MQISSQTLIHSHLLVACLGLPESWLYFPDLVRAANDDGQNQAYLDTYGSQAWFSECLVIRAGASLKLSRASKRHFRRMGYRHYLVDRGVADKANVGKVASHTKRGLSISGAMEVHSVLFGISVGLADTELNMLVAR